MEIYQLYTFTTTFFQTFFDTMGALNPNFSGGFSSYGAWLLTSLGIAFGIWAGLFILQGFGLYYMAKRQNMSKRYLAFVPFASTLYMSKLAGKCSFFGRRMKHAGIYTLIAQILCALITSMVVAAEMYLYIGCGAQLQQIKETIGGVEVVTGVYWTGLSGFSLIAYNFYLYSSYIISIFQLAYEVLMLVVVIALLKKYTPKNYFPLSFLALFVPVSRYIIIFVLKKRKPIDYDAWMRKRRADFMRQQQQYNPYGGYYGGNPYGGNPYGGNPYGAPQNGQNTGAPNGQNTPPDDPFEEFSSSGANTNGQGAPTSENSTAGNVGDSDEFFN